MSLFPIALALLLPWLLGGSLLASWGLHRTAHPALFAGAAFGVGFALISGVLGVLPAVGLPLQLLTGVVSVFLVWIAFLIVGRFGGGLTPTVDSTGAQFGAPALHGIMRGLWWLGVVVLGIQLASTVSRAMIKPVMGPDAVAIHSLRTKVLFYDQTISSATLSWVGSASYPLGIPLAELWVTWFQGRWDDTTFKILFPCFLAAVVAVFYGGLREIYGPLGALLGTWLVAGLPLLVQHATDGYLDLPLAYTSLGASVFLWRYTRSRARGDLAAASWLAAFGVWIKNEGTLAFVVDLLLLAVFFVRAGLLRHRSVWLDLIRFAALPATVWTGWAMFKTVSHITPTLMVPLSALADHADRLPTVLSFVARELWQSANWHVLWPLFFVGWLLHLRRSGLASSLFFAWPVVLIVAVFLAVSEATILYQYLLQGTTLHRIMLHLAPLAAFWVALMLGDRLDGREVIGQDPRIAVGRKLMGAARANIESDF